MDLLCDVSLPRRIALRCMGALSSTGFSLCTVDRPQLKPQAEACATGARRTCAVAARGKTGRKLPQSSCEKCGLKSLCRNSAPAPCSAHLQVSMCLNLQCPPERRLYKSAQKPRCHTDSSARPDRSFFAIGFTGCGKSRTFCGSCLEARHKVRVSFRGFNP